MKFLQRVATSTVIITLVAYLLFFTKPIGFAIFAFVLIGCALFEFFTLLRKSRVPSYRLFGVAIGLVIPALVYAEHGMTRSGDVLFIVLACLFLFLLQFTRKNNSEALVGISMTLFGILYVSWFLSFVLKIWFLPEGAIWVAYLIAVTKSSDIGAYLFGSLLGKHPLMPHVSPKKSVEGLIGGLFLSVLASFILSRYLPIHFSVAHILILGLMIGILAQIGDLSESLMKRFCDAKDSGSIFPGAGGVLDLLDSIIFTAPIFYFHLQVYVK